MQIFFFLFFSNSYRIWTRRRAVSCPIQRCRIAPAVGRADKHSGVRKAVRPLLHPGNCWNHTEITWIILVSPTASDLTRRGGRMAHAVLSWPRERPTRLRGQNKAHALACACKQGSAHTWQSNRERSQARFAAVQRLPWEVNNANVRVVPTCDMLTCTCTCACACADFRRKLACRKLASCRRSDMTCACAHVHLLMCMY